MEEKGVGTDHTRREQGRRGSSYGQLTRFEATGAHTPQAVGTGYKIPQFQ